MSFTWNTLCGSGTLVHHQGSAQSEQEPIDMTIYSATYSKCTNRFWLCSSELLAIKFGTVPGFVNSLIWASLAAIGKPNSMVHILKTGLLIFAFPLSAMALKSALKSCVVILLPRFCNTVSALLTSRLKVMANISFSSSSSFKHSQEGKPSS